MVIYSNLIKPFFKRKELPVTLDLLLLIPFPSCPLPSFIYRFSCLIICLVADNMLSPSTSCQMILLELQRQHIPLSCICTDNFDHELALTQLGPALASLHEATWSAQTHLNRFPDRQVLSLGWLCHFCTRHVVFSFCHSSCMNHHLNILSGPLSFPLLNHINIPSISQL